MASFTGAEDCSDGCALRRGHSDTCLRAFAGRVAGDALGDVVIKGLRDIAICLQVIAKLPFIWGSSIHARQRRMKGGGGRRYILALFALGIATALQASVPSGSINDFITSEMPISGTLGLAYAVVEDDEIHSDARGEMLIGSGRKVTPDTPFVLGSISKSFAAMAVMQLVEGGARSTWIPGFRTIWMCFQADRPAQSQSANC